MSMIKLLGKTNIQGKTIFDTNPSFSPTDLPGLHFWLDATTGLYDATTGGSSITTDESTVARWEDRSGNGVHFTQGTLNARPILKTSQLNGKNVLQFDGSNDALTNLISNDRYSNIGYTYSFVVAKDTNPSSGAPIHLVLYVSSPTSGQARFRVSTKDGTARFSGAMRKNTDNILTIGNTSNSNFNILTYLTKQAEGTHLLRANKSQIASGSFPAGNFATASTPSIGIGNGTTGAAGNAFVGQLAEVIVGTSQLTQSEVDSVESYLSTKWGI